MMEYISENRLLEQMMQSGLRPSLHRLKVFAYIANTKSHPTAEEIYNEMKKLYPSLSRATVYNSLHSLADCNLVRELDLDSGQKRYDYAPQEPHSHFICRKCGLIYDMPQPPVAPPDGTDGFLTENIDVCYRGICPECKEKQ